MDLLIRAGADLNYLDATGYSPLYAAMSAGTAVVKQLIAAGATLYSDTPHTSPCNLAAQEGHTECMEALMSSQQWQSMSVEDRHTAEDKLLHFCGGLAAYSIAVKYALHKHSMLTYLSAGNTPLHSLVKKGRPVPLLCAYIQV